MDNWPIVLAWYSTREPAGAYRGHHRPIRQKPVPHEKPVPHGPPDQGVATTSSSCTVGTDPGRNKIFISI